MYLDVRAVKRIQAWYLPFLLKVQDRPSILKRNSVVEEPSALVILRFPQTPKLVSDTSKTYGPTYLTEEPISELAPTAPVVTFTQPVSAKEKKKASRRSSAPVSGRYRTLGVLRPLPPSQVIDVASRLPSNGVIPSIVVHAHSSQSIVANEAAERPRDSAGLFAPKPAGRLLRRSSS